MKKRLGAIITLVTAGVLLLVATIILVNRAGDDFGEGWGNIAEVSEEFLNQYFEDAKRVSERNEPDDILLVTSRTRPEVYGAVDVVEAPNHLYILQYENAEAKDAAFSKLQADGVIVEENYTQEVMGDSYLSWGIEKMEVDKMIAAVENLESPEAVKVAVIDTGMDLTIFRKYFPERTLTGYCVVTCEGEIDDKNEDGHGTHVGGTIAEGTSDNVEILAIKVTDGVSMYVSDVVTAINYAVANGADVINMSLGGPDKSTAQETALAAAEEAGVINVASAGNNYTDALYYPASFDGVMSIMAVNENYERWIRRDENGNETGFASNYGEKIDFAAPGVLVYGINGWYMSGTSMAAPHIALAAANLKSFNKNVDFDGAMEIFKAQAIDLGDEGWDKYFGYGFVDFSEVEFCESGTICDDYGIFKSEYTVENKTGGAATYNIYDGTMTVTAERATMAISHSNGEYKRILATATEDEKVYTFDLAEASGNEILLVLVGDVTMNGKVNSLDSVTIDYALLSKNNVNYKELTDLQKIIADVTKNNKVNSLDSVTIDYALLSKTNANYRSLDW